MSRELAARTRVENARTNLLRANKRYINYLRFRLDSEDIKADPWLRNQIERHVLFLLTQERDLQNQKAVGQ